jgi:hypothetical protein
VITDGRCLTLSAIDLGPFDALDRIALDRIGFAQIFKQGGEGGKFATDRRAAQCPLFQGRTQDSEKIGR